MIQCRGRNGWFEYKHHIVTEGFIIPKRKRFVIEKTSDDTISIALMSRRTPKTPPIILEGSKDELKSLFTTLLKDLRG